MTRRLAQFLLIIVHFWTLSAHAISSPSSCSLETRVAGIPKYLTPEARFLRANWRRISAELDNEIYRGQLEQRHLFQTADPLLFRAAGAYAEAFFLYRAVGLTVSSINHKLTARLLFNLCEENESEGIIAQLYMSPDVDEAEQNQFRDALNILSKAFPRSIFIILDSPN